MFEKSFLCEKCGEEYPTEDVIYRCGCGGSLNVTYDYREIGENLTRKELDTRIFSHHRYRELLPVNKKENIISLGEGGTPLLKSENIAEQLGLDILYFKLEGVNPTGSFKDRGSSVEVGKALDHGAEKAIVASTGNMGASISAYTAKAGLETTILVPEKVSKIKLEQMKRHGSEIQLVKGDYSAVAEKAWEMKDKGFYLMGDYVYRGEGEKTVGHEIIEQIDADKVVMPVGNGTLMHGVHKGIGEFNMLGLSGKKPEMIGVQARGCSTVSKAFKENSKHVKKVEHVDTDAGAIACADPLDGSLALKAIRDSGGFADSVTDRKIRHARDLLAREEGLYVEITSGAALAGIIENIEKFEKSEKVVCVLTGHGLKDLE